MFRRQGQALNAGMPTYARLNAYDNNLNDGEICMPTEPGAHGPYYGREFLSRIAARFVIDRFRCYPDEATPWMPSLSVFIAKIMYRTQFSDWVLFGALVLIQRLKASFPHARGCSGHRLILPALILASKQLNEQPPKNSAFREIWTFLSLGEINGLERSMCACLIWDLTLPVEANLGSFRNAVTADFCEERTIYRQYLLEDVSSRQVDMENVRASQDFARFF